MFTLMSVCNLTWEAFLGLPYFLIGVLYMEAQYDRALRNYDAASLNPFR